jgi:glycosyltransferase involved in cell wall biosynthesis
LPEPYVGKAKVRYLAPQEQSVFELGKLLKSLDVGLIYINSFFAAMCVKVMWARRLGYVPQNVPILLNPRGEFKPNALRLKRLKKRAYLTLVKLLNVYRNINWQAASEAEIAAIAREFPMILTNAQSWVVKNIFQRADSPPSVSANRGGRLPLKIIFLSRISRSKNLDFALNVLAKCNAQISFDIYGPQEDKQYWQECLELIGTLPSNIQITYKGEIHPDNVVNTFNLYHLFLFPTQTESYGHVIWESLYAGCPVLISDQTPWRDLETRQIGWDFPLNAPDQFVKTIETVASMDDDVYLRYVQAAQRYAQTVAIDETVVEANRLMFCSILQQKG